MLHDATLPLALIVEDTPQISALLARLLEQQGYRTLTAATLAAAVRSLAMTRPQLITLDLQLPDGSGIDLLALLRADPATVSLPVVVISGSLEDAPEVVVQAQAVLAKPFAFSDLVAAVRGLRTSFPPETP